MAAHCRHWLQPMTVTLSGAVVTITIAPETLVDGWFYSLRINHSLNALSLTGTETVAIANGTQTIQLTDWRARQLLSQRLLRGGERLRMVYTKNSLSAGTPDASAPTPVFLVREGIVNIP